MRVAIADDSYIFRRGLVALMEPAGIDVVVEAATGAELLSSLSRVDGADVVVLDLRMPPTHSDEGLTAAVEVLRRWPGTGVLLLSSYSESHHAATLLELDVGGVGYLLKDRVDDETALVTTLDRLATGSVVIEPEVVRGLVCRGRRDALAALSARERAVLELMAQGLSNHGIREALQVSLRTVENHVSAVFDALGLPNSRDENRRVRAVIAYLRASGRPST